MSYVHSSLANCMVWITNNPKNKMPSFYPPNKHRDENDPASLQDMQNSNNLEKRKKLIALSGNSDLAMLAGAYLISNGKVGGPRKADCDPVGLSFNGMKDMAQLVNPLHGWLSPCCRVGSPEEIGPECYFLAYSPRVCRDIHGTRPTRPSTSTWYQIWRHRWVPWNKTVWL